MRTSIVTLLLGAAVVSDADSGATALSLDAATSQALERSADVREAAAEVAAAHARLEGARIPLPANPELELAVGPRSRGGERSTDVQLGVSQQFEVAGQRAVRTQAAQAALAAAEARLAATRVRTAAEIQEAFGRALAAGARVVLAAEAVELAERGHQAAQERFRSGASSRIDVNAGTVERSRAARELVRLERETDAAMSGLKVLIGADPLAQIAPEGDLESWMARPRRERELRPEREHPQVLAARRDLEAAQAERDLASRNAVPNLQLGAAYGREEGADIVQGTVGFALPLFRRNQQERGVTAAHVSRAEAGLTAVALRVHEAETVATSRLEAARRGVAAFSQGALAAARENAALAAEGYEAGKLGFLELLLVRRDALATREAYIEALVELNAAEADVMRAYGQERRASP